MNKIHIAPEQIRYAEWLRWSGWLGLAVLVGAFGLYVAGVLPPVIPVDQLPQAWRLSSRELMLQHGLQGGWSWIRSIARGDMLNMLGIAILSGCSALPLLAVTGIYLRRGDRLFAALCLLQVAVLVLAASGLIAPGH
jgi:hypothetical protein